MTSLVARVLTHDSFVANAFILGMSPWVLALTICVIMSICVVCGFSLQKQAVTRASGHCRIGDITISPLWLIGFSLAIIVPVIGQVVAYGLAPMSLVTPLSGVSVALNLCVSPWFHGERLQLRVDLTATPLILIGMALTSTVGPKTEINYSPAELVQLCLEPAFLTAMSVLLLALGGCVRAMWLKRTLITRAAELNPCNPNMFHVVMLAFAAAGFGAMANILLKTVSEMIAQNLWLDCIALVILLAPAACLELNFINRGLRYYPQTVFFPIYNTFLVFGNTTCGAIYFKEFKILFQDRVNATMYFLGILSIFAGILRFAGRSSGTAEATESIIGDQANPSGSAQKSRCQSHRIELNGTAPRFNGNGNIAEP